MTIYDRKNDFNENHLSLCEVNCTFIRYNSSKAECECITKSHLYTEDDLYQDDLVNKMENNQKSTNLNVMKCNNLLSSSENIKNNTGFYLLAIIIILFIIVMIIFCVKGYNTLENKMDKIIYNIFKPEKNSKKNKSTNIIQIINQNTNIIRKDNRKHKNRVNNSPNNPNSINIHIQNKDQKNESNKDIISKLKTTNTVNHKEKSDNFLKCTNDYELNNLPFKLAFKYDKRNFCDYYFSLIRTKQLIFFSFCDFNDYNSGIVKKFIFFLSFALH